METTPGKRVQMLREAKGYTSLTSFAEHTGVKVGTLSALEADKSAPSMDTLSKLLTAFPDLNMDWLINEDGGMLKGGRNLVLAKSLSSDCPPTEVAAIATLTRQLGEAHARVAELEAELRDERKQARHDLRLQGTYYNSVKEDQAALIKRLYARIDELELRLGFRMPTAEERKQQEQSSSCAPRMEVISFGGRYRNAEPAPVEAPECVVRAMYPEAEVSHCEAA